MTNQQSTYYRQAKAIVHQALDLPTSERAAFVEVHCGDDAVLRQEANWLLSTTQHGDGFLEIDPLRQVEPDADDVVKISTPRDYKIVRRLGEGGHGVVFLAERSDGKFRQAVALKLLNFAGQLSPNATARFLAERQILAQLNHPNIAHLLDAGALPDGRPFLAMEFVDGAPITRHCNQNDLGIRERVQLFLKVCSAVGYAHQQLVIHRDLKPANIMVTAEGEPKLLDFGIARLLIPHDDIAIPATEHGHHLLTLFYASPEQIRGEQLSTTSDIYSLGVVLYEMLTGTPPFTSDGDSVALTRTICESEPQRPSQRSGRNTSRNPATGGQTRDPLKWPTGRRQVSPDLDAIVLKALRKRAEDRYGSVHELIDDLKRYLDNRPVLARKGHFSYRARRYLQRNRWTVAATVAFVTLTFAFMLNRQFELERTTLERDKAQRLADFMSSLFRNANPTQSGGEKITVRELLDQGAEATKRTRIDPRLKASMLASIGDAYTGLGLSKQAVPLLTAASALERSPVERSRMLISLAEAYSLDGDYKRAIDEFGAARDLLRSDGGDQDELIARTELQMLHNRILLADSPLEPLIAQLNELIDKLKSRSETSDSLLLDAYGGLGLAYNANSEYNAAADALAKAIDLSTKLHGGDALSTIHMRRRQAQSVAFIDPAEAAQLFERVASDHVRMVGSAQTIFHATVLSDLAVVLSRSGELEQSIAVAEKARSIARDVSGPEDRYYLQLTGNLASQLNKLGRKEEAAAMLRETVPVLSQLTSGFDRLIYAHSLASLGVALEDRDDVEAERTLGLAEQVLSSHRPEGYLDVYEGILYRLTKAQIKLRRHKEAEASLSRLKEVEEKIHSPTSGLRSHALQVDLLMAYGRYKDAETLSAKGLALARDAAGECSTYAKRLREQYVAAKKQLGSAVSSDVLQACNSGLAMAKKAT